MRKNVAGQKSRASLDVPVPAQSDSTNATAIISLYSALIGLGLPAVVFGHIALDQMRTSSERGRSLAEAGLLFGYIEVIVTVAVLVNAFGIPGF
ncbi:DUF4190 domain-containing protein [Rhodococcus koreensis]